MKAPKSINITQGINPKKLIHLLQNNQVLLLKGKKKIFKIQKDFIQIFQNQVLTLEQIPSNINDLELNNIQKIQLLNNGVINIQNHKISLDKNLLQLNIQKNIGQRKLKIR